MALFKALDGATSYIHIEYYIFAADDVSNRITDILLQKQVADVGVRVMG